MNTKMFNKQLRKYRNRKKLTYAELSEKTESSASYLWQLENSEDICPSLTIAQNLAEALDTTVQALLGEDEEAEKEVIFMRKFRKLDPVKRDYIIDIMDILST